MKTLWKTFALTLAFILVINLNVLAKNQLLPTNLNQEAQEKIENNAQENLQDKEQPHINIEEKILNAILNKNPQEVKNLVSKVSELQNKNELLRVAVSMNDQEIVAILLQTGINISSTSEGGQLLLIAVLMGHTEIARQLIAVNAPVVSFLEHEDGREIEITSLRLLPTMFNKTKNKYFEMLEILLGAGADPNVIISMDNGTILMDAASQGNLQAVEALIKAKANVNAKTINGITPCSCAQENNYLEIVKLLQKAGAVCKNSGGKSISNIQNNYKTTLKDTLINLIAEDEEGVFGKGFSLDAGQLVKIKKSIAKNEINQQDEQGDTALMSFLKVYESNGAPINPILDLLIESGIDLNLKNIQGDTALLIISKKLSLNVSSIGRLISAGANVQIRDNDGRTPLINLIKNFLGIDFLSYKEDIYFAQKTIEDLVNAGTDINAQDSDGKTALMYAVLLEEDDGLSLPFAKKLLELGADPSIKDNNGKTAFEQKGWAD